MASHHRSSSGSFRALSRHEKYFLNGGDLFFLMEHVTFRVHRYFFERESPFFQRQLQVPASPGAIQPGSGEGCAIILEEPPEDFAKFLWVFYNPRYSLYQTSVEDWKVILRLAHKWQFAEVKKLVVRELEMLDFPDVDRIATYQDHDVDRDFLIPRYAALCEREQPLTLAEGRQLGMETVLMIARSREYARANPSLDGARSPTSAGIREDEMHSLIRTVFEIRAPEPRVNGEDQTDDTGSGSGAGSPTGGLLPPPPKPALVIPTDKPTAKPTDKPTDTPTAKPTDTPVLEKTQTGNQEKGQQGKGKGKGKKGKTGPATPLVTPPTPIVVQEPPQKPTEGKGEGEAADESLIDFDDPSSSVGSGPQETKDTGVVNGLAGNVKLEEPVQNGDANKTGESATTEETVKSDDAVSGGNDEVKVEQTTGGSEKNADDAGDS